MASPAARIACTRPRASTTSAVVTASRAATSASHASSSSVATVAAVLVSATATVVTAAAGAAMAAGLPTDGIASLGVETAVDGVTVGHFVVDAEQEVGEHPQVAPAGRGLGGTVRGTLGSVHAQPPHDLDVVVGRGSVHRFGRASLRSILVEPRHLTRDAAGR